MFRIVRHDRFIAEHTMRRSHNGRSAEFIPQGSGLPIMRTVTRRLLLRAFTLIELLMVIGLIAILAAILLPVISKAKEQGRSMACLSNLRQLGIVLQLYVQDHENKLPTIYDALLSTNAPATNLATVDIVLTNYLGAPRILRCLSDDKQLFEKTASSYAWNSLLNGQDADHLQVFSIQFDPHHIPLMFDKEAFHRARGEGKGVNYLYADGHIKNLLVLEGTK